MKYRALFLSFAAIGVLLLLSAPVSAQVAVSDNVKLGLSGEISTGYTGQYGSGSSDGSSHALDFGGSGSLHGYYYNPQFLSFDVQPYYNRSQANSSFQSITDSSGFTGTVNVFGGSHFPGSISVGKTVDSLGQFGVPGVTGLSTDTSGHTVEINWAALFPNRPTLNVSYVIGAQDASVFGSDARTNLNTKTLNVHSNYNYNGFQLTGFLIHQSIDASFPAVVNLSGPSSGSSDQQGGNNSYGIIATHKIPLRGYWTTNITRTTYGSNTEGNDFTSSSNGSSNSFSSSASIQPIKKLGISFGATYQTNVLGAIQAQIVQAGGNPALADTDASSKAVVLRADSYYQLTSHISINGQWNHTQQYLDGKSIGLNQYGAGISSSFMHRLFGSLTFAVGAVDTATQEGNSGTGMYGNVNFLRRFGSWETGADFNYSQQVQTLGSVYTTSVYGYGGSIRKKWGNRLYWTNSVRESRSGLTQIDGSNSHSQSFSSTFAYRGYSATGIYSQSGGAAILTSQGLVPVPGGIPPLVRSAVLYDARSFGGSLTATSKRFSLTGSYSKALSETTATTLARNDMTLWNGLFRMRMRKLYFNAGFTRFGQSVGTVGAPPSMVNTYFVGVSRWFNIF